MTWHARLQLDYTVEAERCVLRHQHSGPLRILQSLYPEGDAVCHNVLVHPPGGLVGGDTLDITATVGPGAHGLLTTPGATRFYRSAGERALQRTELTLAEGARLEWLPLEALCYDACQAENRLTMHLAPGAGLLGWDVTALGLPGASLPFARGKFQQHLEVPGLWLERGLIDAADTRLLDSPLGREDRQSALDAAREVIDAHPLAATAGATSPNGRVVIVRALAPLVEPAMDLMQRVRGAWRKLFWQLPPTRPRIWAM